MKIRSILMAVSATALMAGTAHAQSTVMLGDANGSPGDSNDTAPALVIATQHADVTGLSIPVEIVYSTGGLNLPETASYNVTVSLDDDSGVLVFGSSLPLNALTDAGNMGFVNSSLVFSGNAGATNAQFLASVTGSGVSTFALPMVIEFTEDICTDPSDTYSVRVNVLDTITSLPIFGGSVVGDIITCSDAVTAVIAEDADDTVIDLGSIGTEYTTFSADSALVGPGSSPFSANLGTVELTVDTNAIIELDTNPIFTGNSVLMASNIASVDFTVNYAQTTDIAATDLEVNGTALASVSATTAQSVISLAGLSATGPVADIVAGSPIELGATSAVAGEILTQRVIVKDLVVAFDPSLSLDPVELGDGDLDTLEREGLDTGFYDWVAGDNGSGVTNVFRITGIPTDPVSGDALETLIIDVEFENAQSGGDASIPITIPASDIEGGTAFVDSSMFEAINPGFGVADIRLSIRSSGTLDVDRLMVDATGGLNTYGGGANDSAVFFEPNTPNNDQSTGRFNVE